MSVHPRFYFSTIGHQCNDRHHAYQANLEDEMEREALLSPMVVQGPLPWTLEDTLILLQCLFGLPMNPIVPIIISIRLIRYLINCYKSIEPSDYYDSCMSFSSELIRESIT